MREDNSSLRDAPAAREPDPVKCPHCSQPLAFEVVAKVREQSEMSFKITPHPGEFCTLGTIGNSIASMEKLLKAVGKEMGIKTTVLLRQVETEADGALRFDMIVARGDKRPRREAHAEGMK